MLGASVSPRTPPEARRRFDSRDFASTRGRLEPNSARRVPPRAIHSLALDRVALLERPEAMCYLDRATVSETLHCNRQSRRAALATAMAIGAALTLASCSGATGAPSATIVPPPAV